MLAATGPQRATANPHDSLLANLLDDMACALLIVDRSRAIHYANAAGHEALSQGVFLRNQDGILTATPHARPMLNLVIATVLHHADVCRHRAQEPPAACRLEGRRGGGENCLRSRSGITRKWPGRP